MSESESDGVVEYVFVGPHAWGKDTNEYDAFQNMVVNLNEPGRLYGPSEDAETIGATMFKVRGFEGVGGARGDVRAEEMLRRRDMRLDIDETFELKELLGEAELQAEQVLVNAEDVTDEHDE